MTSAEYDQHRQNAIEQANSDLSKSRDWLLADIHDEATNGQSSTDALVHILKRFSALLVLASQSADRQATVADKQTRQLKCWTVAIVALTLVLVFLTCGLFYYAYQTDKDLRELPRVIAHEVPAEVGTAISKHTATRNMSKSTIGTHTTGKYQVMPNSR